MDSPFLTVAQAAAELRCDSESVMSLIDEGKLLAFNVASPEVRARYRIPRQNILLPQQANETAIAIAGSIAEYLDSSAHRPVSKRQPGSRLPSLRSGGAGRLRRSLQGIKTEDVAHPAPVFPSVSEQSKVRLARNPRQRRRPR